MTSAGSSRWVAPGFSAVATVNARRTASGTMRRSWMRVFHLVIGRNISTTSMNWWVSLCISASSTWPVRATSGAWSRLASATPVARLVAPGTEGGQTHAGLAGQAAVGVGHERRALLVTGGDERDLRRLLERLADVERLFAGDTEDVLDALALETAHEQIGGELGSAGRRAPAGGGRALRASSSLASLAGAPSGAAPQRREPAMRATRRRVSRAAVANAGRVRRAAAPSRADRRRRRRAPGIGPGHGSRC